MKQSCTDNDTAVQIHRWGGLTKDITWAGANPTSRRPHLMAGGNQAAHWGILQSHTSAFNWGFHGRMQDLIVVPFAPGSLALSCIRRWVVAALRRKFELLRTFNFGCHAKFQLDCSDGGLASVGYGQNSHASELLRVE